MKTKRLACLVLILALVGLAISACSPAAAPEAPAEPTATPAQPPPPPTPAPPEKPAAKSPCGDGVCDEVEQKNPDLCPQDCAPAPTEKAEAPTEPAATATPEPKPPTPTPPPPAPTTAPDTPTPEPAVTEAPPSTPAPETEAPETVTLSSGEVAYLGNPSTITQEGGGEGVTRQANLAFILDGSGSMNAELPGSGTTKLVVAKEVMTELVPQVPPEVNGALWIYGHRYPQDPKEESCKDIEQVFAMGPVDAGAYTQKINAVTALGYTPISDSIEQAARDLPAGDLNSIILVSDGEETCEGDPCALAEALKASDAEVTIHVVGYAVEEVAREQLECIAQVSGGTYHDAQDAEGLLQALKEAMAATVAETILRVELMGADGTEMRDDVYLYEAGTDRLVSGYSTWKDNAVPPGSYDLLVASQPPTVYQGLSIGEGSTTIARIILSAIRVLTPDGEEARFDLLDAATDEPLGQLNGTVFLLPGVYKVSANNSTSDPITLDAGELEEVVLGAIKVLGPEREEARFDLIDPDTHQWLSQENGTVFLLPGTYKVGVGDSASDPITLDAGQTEELVLGAIRVLGPGGGDARFDLMDPDTDEWLGQENGTVLVLPGTYKVVVSDGPTFEKVVVEAGEVTIVK
jgi:hypothetical protein